MSWCVTRFVMSWCVTRFCNSEIIDPYQSCFKTAKVYLKNFLKGNRPVFSFVNSYKSSPNRMAPVIENNRFLKAPEKKYTFSKCYRKSNILEIFWVCYTKNKLPIIFTKYEKPHFPTLSKFKILMRLKKIFFLFVNSYKSAPNQKADVIENNRFLKAPENEYIFSKCYRNLNISEIFWVCYTKNKLYE